MFGVALLTSALLALAAGRIYERCELARDLASLGIRKEHLATWICIAFHESRFDTAARNPYSGDHGLLQISELYWCGAGKACGLPCSALRDEDITDDVECALRIHEEHTRLQGNGFLAWVVYPQHCKHNTKKYLADCESSVKTPSVRTNVRSRVIESDYRNVTSFSYNPKIDELLPPYLTIGSVFQGNYEKEFEQNYKNKVKIDWLNYKIDNIDKLKLPVLNQKIIGEHITTTVTTTTITTSSTPLPNIKPPSPRRIESNSFRRRKIRPLHESVKFIKTTDASRISASTITPSIYISTTENIQRQDNLLKSTTASIPLITKKNSTTIRPLTKNLDLFAYFRATPSTTSEEKTTRSPIIYTDNPIQTTMAQKVSSLVTDGLSSKMTSITENSTIRSINRNLLIGKRNSSFSEIKSNSSVNKSHNGASLESTSILTSTSATPTVAIKDDRFNFKGSQKSSTTSIPWSWSERTWKTTSKSITTTTTSKPSPVTWKTDRFSNTLAQKNGDNSMTESKNQSTSSNLWAKTRAWLDSKVAPVTELLTSKSNTSSTRTNALKSTTPKPRFTIPTVNLRSTANPTVSVKSTTNLVTPTELPPLTTVRTTQSIFDLYLNPTTRPKISTFSLPPFKNKGFRLRIFAGGTTTHAPTFLRSNGSRSALEPAAKNEIRR